MNAIQIYNALNSDNFYTISAIFQSQFLEAKPKKYTYKVSKQLQLKENDMVVVKTPSAGYQVVRVEAVHEVPDIDPRATFLYKWVVDKVDTDLYVKLVESEEDMVQEIKNNIKAKQIEAQKEIAKEFVSEDILNRF